MSDPKGLGWDKEDDLSLYNLYAKKLPRRGWAGRMDKAGRTYARRLRAGRQKSILRGVCISVQTASTSKAVPGATPPTS